MVAVRGVDPLEARVVVVPHGGGGGVDLVEALHQGRDARVTLLVQQPPIKGVGLVPLLLLADLLAHEEELLARVAPLVGVQGTQAREGRCHLSPGIFEISEPLPCTTSSCESGST